VSVPVPDDLIDALLNVSYARQSEFIATIDQVYQEMKALGNVLNVDALVDVSYARQPEFIATVNQVHQEMDVLGSALNVTQRLWLSNLGR
jgi:hypothetical protein